MSILSQSNPNLNTAARTPSFQEFKKLASFFLREKIKFARLALTDVTPAELLAEEAVSGNSPGSPTLHRISRAAFEIGDFWRIVEVLHGRLASFDKRNWRVSYNSLTVLKHLLIHGPESDVNEFQIDKDFIALCGTFQYIDEIGFNWGIAVKKKSERILKAAREWASTEGRKRQIKETEEGHPRIWKFLRPYSSFTGFTISSGIWKM